MDLVEQVHIFGLTKIHTFEPNTNLIRLFSLMLNYAQLRLIASTGYNLGKIKCDEQMHCKMEALFEFSQNELDCGNRGRLK